MSPTETQLATLAPHAREWAEAVLDEYQLTATGKALVLEGARALDLIEQAREERTALVKDGRYAGSSKIDSLFTVERGARQDFLRVVSTLKLQEADDGARTS
jgi:hypothetical protein